MTWLIFRPGAGSLRAPGPKDYVRMPIPHAVVQDVHGTESTLRALAASRARLLILLSRTCAPCVRVVERIDA